MNMPGDRVTCTRCGANNFNTVTSCWKCSAPLAAFAPVTAAQERPLASGAPAYIVAAQGDAGAARRAAIWLSVLIPWLGVPIGWAFIMTGEPQKQDIGRFCVLWSSVCCVLHLLVMFGSMMPLVSAGLQMMHGGHAGAAGGLGGLGGLGGQ